MSETAKTFEQIAEGVLDQEQASTSSESANANSSQGAQGSQAGADVSAGEAGAETAQAAPTLKDRLSELSFQFGEQDDDSVAQERLLAAYQDQQARYQELQDRMEMFRLQQLMKLQADTEQTATQQETQTSEKWWNPPQVDESLVRQYATVDESGALQWKPETPLALRSSYEARQAYRANFADQFLSDPQAALSPMLQQHEQSIQRMVEQAIQRMEQAQAQKAVVDDFVKTNESWLYNLDPVTQQPKVVGGQPQLSEAGHNFNAIYVGLLERGIDEATALTAAHGLYTQRYGNRESTKQQIAVNRLQHLQNGATSAASRNGHQSALAAGKLSGQAAKTNESFEDIFWRNFRAVGGGE